MKLLAAAIGTLVSIAVLLIVDFNWPVKNSALVKNLLNSSDQRETFLNKFVVPAKAYSGLENKKAVSESDLLESMNVAHFKKMEKILTSKERRLRVQSIAATDNRILNEVTYTTDLSLRRKSPFKKSILSDVGVVYIGCSFTFGEDLSDDETLVVAAEKLMPHIHQVNLGLPSLGLNDIYAQLYVPNYRIPGWEDTFDPHQRYLDLPLKKIILVYYFIGDHLFRAQCSQRCLYEDEALVREKPYFEVQDDQLVFSGTHRDHENIFSKVLSKSHILKQLGIDIPFVTNEINIRRHQLFLKKIKEAYAKKYQVIDAYTLYSPFDDYRIINKVESHSIKSFKPIIFDKAAVLSTYGVGNLLTPYTGHPTALMNRISAAAVNWRLREDHPELFNLVP